MSGEAVLRHHDRVTIRVLLADDHAVVRDGLAAVLGLLDDFEVVGQAATGSEAVATARRTRPDVVLMDVRMPEGGGVEATRAILEIAPETAVLFLTMFDDDATVIAAMQAGARGYLLKDAGHDEVAAALRAVVAGQTILGRTIADRMVEAYSAAAPQRPYPFPQLNDREREILDLLVQGQRTAEIAATVHLSPKTVSNLLTVVFQKLGVTGRADAIRHAHHAGLDTGG